MGHQSHSGRITSKPFLVAHADGCTECQIVTGVLMIPSALEVLP